MTAYQPLLPNQTSYNSDHTQHSESEYKDSSLGSTATVYTSAETSLESNALIHVDLAEEHFNEYHKLRNPFVINFQEK